VANSYRCQLIRLAHIYTHRSDAPPLKIVVEDASHVACHMVQSKCFWFPRIEPGEMMVVEDTRPIQNANRFRTQFLPQNMSALHCCGDPKEPRDEIAFQHSSLTFQSILGEMHICVFKRNQKRDDPSLSRKASTSLPNAWT
jgi:hypothetical protein